MLLDRESNPGLPRFANWQAEIIATRPSGNWMLKKFNLLYIILHFFISRCSDTGTMILMSLGSDDSTLSRDFTFCYLYFRKHCTAWINSRYLVSIDILYKLQAIGDHCESGSSNSTKTAALSTLKSCCLDFSPSFPTKTRPPFPIVEWETNIYFSTCLCACGYEDTYVDLFSWIISSEYWVHAMHIADIPSNTSTRQDISRSTHANQSKPTSMSDPRCSCPGNEMIRHRTRPEIPKYWIKTNSSSCAPVLSTRPNIQTIALMILYHISNTFSSFALLAPPL